MKRVTLECGGKSPQVVFRDADLDLVWFLFIEKKKKKKKLEEEKKKENGNETGLGDN